MNHISLLVLDYSCSPIKGLLPLTGIKTPRFENSASKVAGLQVHATTPGSKSLRSVYSKSGEDILEVNENSHKVSGIPFLVTYHPYPNFLSNTEILKVS